MAKRIIYNEQARRALEKGIDILCEAVAVTLGPKGRNVVLEKKFGAPQIVNDGVTIAKEIELEDHGDGAHPVIAEELLHFCSQGNGLAGGILRFNTKRVVDLWQLSGRKFNVEHRTDDLADDAFGAGGGSSSHK